MIYYVINPYKSVLVVPFNMQIPTIMDNANFDPFSSLSLIEHKIYCIHVKKVEGFACKNYKHNTKLNILNNKRDAKFIYLVVYATHAHNKNNNSIIVSVKTD